MNCQMVNQVIILRIMVFSVTQFFNIIALHLEQHGFYLFISSLCIGKNWQTIWNGLENSLNRKEEDKSYQGMDESKVGLGQNVTGGTISASVFEELHCIY